MIEKAADKDKETEKARTEQILKDAKALASAKKEAGWTRVDFVAALKRMLDSDTGEASGPDQDKPALTS